MIPNPPVELMQAYTEITIPYGDAALILGVLIAGLALVMMEVLKR